MRLFRLVNAAASMLLLFDLFIAQPEPPGHLSQSCSDSIIHQELQPSDSIRFCVALTEGNDLIISDSSGVVTFPADSLQALSITADSSQVGEVRNLLTELLQRLEAVEETVKNYRETLTDTPGTWQFPGLLQCLKIK